MKKTELLSPAGNLKNLRYAFSYGADAVYAGQPRYSLRVRNNDFNDVNNLAIGINEAHALGKQFYLAVNLFPHNSKLKTFLADMEEVISLKPDALIMADVGLIMMVREKWSEMPIHLSVQANTMNYAAVKFWQSAGISRIILSRELSLDEIAEIRQQCPDMELEVFVHGALCIAYSGRCLLSGYINHRDANQGTCTNSCRWEYKVHPAQETAGGDIQKIAPQNPQIHQETTTQWRPLPDLGEGEPTDGLYLIEEMGRPNELMPIFEDEHGTYIMNSKDLRAIQHVQRLTEMGINSLKIEGRTKSYYYVARTAQVYRQAIDDAVAGRPFDKKLMDELENLASRGYTEGFYRRHVHDEYQNYQNGSSVGELQQFVGEVLAREGNWLKVDVKNHFRVGDTLELLSPTGNRSFILTQLHNLKRENINAALGSGYVVYVFVPNAAELENVEKCLLIRYLVKQP
ncbi:collagenase-like protease [Beggiatoa alba B18LD]|uniref:Collagenase-like protease n=1 Tax=Beggiatoa alba B18LD TaxID=395493 RepID=I3CH41_9GAMM|nr:tRNA 5-hydroxyuridine modification protein YegQ [Beggiatoa alba]EIJ42934.1 collagenase-like protease [Beggiatoa alba B18LD]